MPDLSFRRFRGLTAPAEEADFRDAMAREGYYAFYSFVEDYREALKAYADDNIGTIGALLERSRRLFPSPGRFSPSWDKLWNEFEALCRAKNEVLAAFGPNERDGEWQVILDNPFSTNQVVCYPGMSFLDAAYLYAYFQSELKPNEILRLQKVVQALAMNGSKEASLLPES